MTENKIETEAIINAARTDKNKMLVLVATVLTTLYEVDGAPESELYMVCQTNMDLYQQLRHILVSGKFITIKANWMTLTEHGKLTAERLNKALMN